MEPRHDRRGAAGFSHSRLRDDGTIRNAAAAAFFGIPPSEILDQEDDFRASVLVQVVEHLVAMEERRQHNIANLTANGVARALGG